MIRYAITAGNYDPFLKRNQVLPPSCASTTPMLLDETNGPRGGLRLPPPSLVSLTRHLQQLATEGVDYLQLREKHLTIGELVALTRHLLACLHDSPRAPRTCLLLNGRADAAAAAGAHGVHLPATPGSLRPAHVRRLYRTMGLPRPVVSSACHSLAEVRMTCADPPDLILFSPIFGKCVDGLPVAPAVGLQALERACTLAAPTPVLALGGVTPQNISDCLRAGSAGVAGIRLFARDVQQP